MLYVNKDFRIYEKGILFSNWGSVKYIRLGNEEGYYYDITIPRYLFTIDSKVVHKGFYENLTLQKIGNNNYKIVEERDDKYFAILSSFDNIFYESNIFTYNTIELKKAYAISPYKDKFFYGIYKMCENSFIKINYRYNKKRTIVIKDNKIIECNYEDNRLDKSYYKIDFGDLQLDYIRNQDLTALKLFIKNYKQLANCLIVENGKKIKDVHSLYKSAFNKVDMYKFRYHRNKIYNKTTGKSYRIFNDDDNVVIYFCVPTDDLYYNLSILMKIYFNVFIDREVGLFQLYEKDILKMNAVLELLEDKVV